MRLSGDFEIELFEIRFDPREQITSGSNHPDPEIQPRLAESHLPPQADPRRLDITLLLSPLFLPIKKVD